MFQTLLAVLILLRSQDLENPDNLGLIYLIIIAKRLLLSKKCVHFKINFPPLRVWLSKLKALQTIFMAIFEFSVVENPSKRRVRIEFRNCRIFKKYYVCVLNFSQIWFSQKSIGFQIVTDMNQPRPLNFSQKVCLGGDPPFFY